MPSTGSMSPTLPQSRVPKRAPSRQSSSKSNMSVPVGAAQSGTTVYRRKVRQGSSGRGSRHSSRAPSPQDGLSMSEAKGRRLSLDETRPVLQTFSSTAQAPFRRRSFAESERDVAMFYARRNRAHFSPQRARSREFDASHEPRARLLPRHPSLASTRSSFADDGEDSSAAHIESASSSNGLGTPSKVATPLSTARIGSMRDMFARRDDDDAWVDEDDDLLFRGGIGQTDIRRSGVRAELPSTTRYASQLPGQRASSPAPPRVAKPYRTGLTAPSLTPVPSGGARAPMAYLAMLGPPLGAPAPAVANVRGIKNFRAVDAPVIEEDETEP